MSRYTIGIDPGAKGAWAILDNDGTVAGCDIFPYKGDDVDWWRWTQTMGQIVGADAKALVAATAEAYVEKVHAMPSQGVVSMFSMGSNFGGITAALDVGCFPYRLVTPQAWKKLVLAGTDKDKLAAITYVGRAYPTLDLRATPRSRVPHDGKADAVCIAEYGMRFRGKK